MPRLSYRAARDQHDHDAFLRLVARSFAFPVGNLAEWLALIGRENLRFVEEKGTLRGALALLPMGQWFGGRCVPMGGVVAVGIEPEVRGLGVGKALMEGLLRELGDRGLMLSTLFPSTTAFYRRCGYELAGTRYEVKVALAALPRKRAPLSIRRGDEKDEPAVRALYAQQAARSPGHLQRHDYIWGRVKVWRDETRELYLFERGKELAGYCWLVARRPEAARQELFLSDFVCAGVEAAETLVALLAGHRSLADHAGWFGRDDDPLFLALEEAVAPHLTVKLSMPWMTRMVDAAGALEARGYSPALSATLGFELSDPLLAHNRGRFRLRVERGRAKVEKGGRGDLKLDVRALAALFTGQSSASTLAGAGRLAGSDGAIALADGIFAGPAPAMPDMF
jgi:predicted acetyltransferase